MEYILSRKQEIIEHINRLADTYNYQAELCERLVQEMKRATKSLEILDERLDNLIAEYNLAAEMEDNE